jgi:hypothetical protein
MSHSLLLHSFILHSYFSSFFSKYLKMWCTHNKAKGLFSLLELVVIIVSFRIKFAFCNRPTPNKLQFHNRPQHSKPTSELSSFECPVRLGSGYKCGWEINQAFAAEGIKGSMWSHVIFHCQTHTHIPKTVSTCTQNNCEVDNMDKTARVCGQPQQPIKPKPSNINPL